MNFADKNYNKTIIQRLVGPHELLTVYCAGTNMPLVDCSQETFNDRAFVLESEDILKEFVKPYLEKKMPLKGIKFPQKDKMQFFSTLLYINVDELVYIDKNGEHTVALSEFIKKQDVSNLPVQKRPVENPQLQLSGLYFVQEACRAIPMEEKTELKDLEEELASNLVKGKYILPVMFADEENKEETDANENGDEVTEGTEQPRTRQFKIPMIKTPKDELFIPLFTDNVEFAKYRRKNKCSALVVPFAGLERLLAKEAKGFMLNPNGFHITMPLPLLKGLAVRFGITPVGTPAASGKLETVQTQQKAPADINYNEVVAEALKTLDFNEVND